MSTFFTAAHYDGQKAVKRNVEVEVIGPQFYVVENAWRSGPFAFADVAYVTKQGETDVYGLDGHDGWRLMLFSPQWLAPLIPDSVDDRLGDALVGDFGGRFCATPAGDAALQKLVASLDDAPQDLRVEVANIDMLNAVALPGGNVILFDGLLKQARSPDEVAGVLAHEIGHVREKHVMQALLRQMGLAVVLGGVDGNSGAVVNNMLAMSYSRNAEAEADAYSMQALGNANISPVGTASFFDRLSALDGSAGVVKDNAGITGYLSSHPLSTSRKEAFEKSIVKGRSYKPALTPSEWIELKTMCTQDRKAKSGLGFDFN
jgi:beta-barrel assembly-enhancing protease